MIRAPEPYENVRETEVEMEGAEKCTVRWLLHGGKGAKNFAMRQYTLYEGGHTPYHQHDFEHEVFCLEGEGTVVLEDKEYPFLPGYYVLVPENIMHNFVNRTEKPFKFLCLIPGEIKGG